MNAIELARQAYAPSPQTLRTPRSIEAQLFSEITRRLSRAKDDHPALVAAVHDNRQIWVTLAIDVADPDNALPQPLRAQIYYLAEFTEQHSQKFLRGEASVDALIEINTAILKGLRGEGERQ